MGTRAETHSSIVPSEYSIVFWDSLDEPTNEEQLEAAAERLLAGSLWADFEQDRPFPLLRPSVRATGQSALGEGRIVEDGQPPSQWRLPRRFFLLAAYVLVGSVVV